MMKPGNILLVTGVMLLSVMLAGCRSQDTDGEKLSFLASDFCDKEGYTFDGMRLLDSYEVFEKRLNKTGVEPARYEIEPAGADLTPALSDAGEIPAESGLAVGRLTVVGCHDLTMEEPAGAKGYAEYRFYNDQFMGGTMEFRFEDYESACQYVRERMEAPRKVQDSSAVEKAKGSDYLGYDIQESETEDSLQGGYVDEAGVYLEIAAYCQVGGSGLVRVFFQENLDYDKPDSKKNSRYFDFSEPYKTAVIMIMRRESM